MKKPIRIYIVPVLCLVSASVILASCNLPAPTASQAVPPASQEGLASPTATTDSGEADAETSTATVSPTPGPCDDQALFITDVTFPDDAVVKTGLAFTKTWRLRNTGSCTWDASYKLVFVRGQQMEGLSPAQVITTPVKPGDLVDLSIPMKAPATNGTHFGVWQLYNGAGEPVNMVNGDPQEVSIKILIQDGTGGMVTKVQGWRYTYLGMGCSSSTQYDVWTSIFTSGPVSANYVWSTTSGVLTGISQTYVFTSSGSHEVTTHISPPFADPNNIRVTLTVNGSIQGSFTICP